MNRMCAVTPVLFVALWVFSGAGTEARAHFSRETPVTKAVQKTEPSIVAIKVPSRRRGGRPSIGTGVIIDERGYIITNYHVVGGRSEVDVHLADKTKLTGYVALRLPENDLAVLRVRTSKRLKALRFATASDLKKGESVIAIGHPYGYEFTVTAGLVANLDQSIEMPSGEVLKGLILTSAPINPGNSGGPLLNINGELIGINVALRQGAQGIAFAINANTVCSLLAKKLSALEISQVGHGLHCKEKVLAETGDRQRAVVRFVQGPTPAGQAGLQQGDIICAVNGYKVRNRFDVERMMWGRRAGEEVRLRVVRGNENMTVRLTLMDAQSYQQAATKSPTRGTQHVSTRGPRRETPASHSETITQQKNAVEPAFATPTQMAKPKLFAPKKTSNFSTPTVATNEVSRVIQQLWQHGVPVEAPTPENMLGVPHVERKAVAMIRPMQFRLVARRDEYHLAG